MKKTIQIFLCAFLLLSCDPLQRLIITTNGRPNTSVGMYMDKRGLPHFDNEKGGKIVLYVPVDSTNTDSLYSSFRIGSWGNSELDTLTHYIDSIVVKNEFSTSIYRSKEEIRNYLDNHKTGYLKSTLTIAPEDTLNSQNLLGQWLIDNRDSSFYKKDTLVFIRNDHPKKRMYLYKIQRGFEINWYAMQNYKQFVEIGFDKKNHASLQSSNVTEKVYLGSNTEGTWQTNNNLLTFHFDEFSLYGGHQACEKHSIKGRFLFLNRKTESIMFNGEEYKTYFLYFIRQVD